MCLDHLWGYLCAVEVLLDKPNYELKAATVTENYHSTPGKSIEALFNFSQQMFWLVVPFFFLSKTGTP